MFAKERFETIGVAIQLLFAEGLLHVAFRHLVSLCLQLPFKRLFIKFALLTSWQLDSLFYYCMLGGSKSEYAGPQL